MNLTVLFYPIIVAFILFILVFIYLRIPKDKKDKFTEKTKITGFSLVTFYIFLITNPIFLEAFAGKILSQLAASILDFISLVSITVGILEIILSVRFKEFIDKTNSSIQPMSVAIEDFKKEHIKIYNLTQLNAFTKQDPIFNHEIVKQEGYLHIASLMRDFGTVLGGKFILRSYEQFLNALNLLAEILDKTYNITVVDHIDVTQIPETMSGGYSFIEEYSSVLNNLYAKVNSNSFKRVVILDREEDKRNEKLLLLLFSQLEAIPSLYLISRSEVSDMQFYENRIRILITKNKNECCCNSSVSCDYCYSIKFVSPYNGKQSDGLFKGELNKLKNDSLNKLKNDSMKNDSDYSQKFPNYIKIFHSQKKYNIQELNNDKTLFTIGDNQNNNQNNTKITKDDIFNLLLTDQKIYYSLYKDVNTAWIDNLKSEKTQNIYGCDTTLLDNEIEEWLNRPFYQYVLRQNNKDAKKLKNKGKILKRFFIIDKVRESKIQALSEIINEHIKHGIAVSIVPISKLIDQDVEYIFDFNFIENVCIFEIAGLRRKYDRKDQKFKLIVSDKVPTYPCWKKYDNNNNNNMYMEIVNFKGILDSVEVKIEEGEIVNFNETLRGSVLKEPSLEAQEKILNENMESKNNE